MVKKNIRLDISDEMIAERRGGLSKMPKDMSFGILLKPPLRSAIISSEISSLIFFLTIIYYKKIKRT